MDRIYLLIYKESALERILENNANDNRIKWVYFGDSIEIELKIENKIGSRAIKTDIGGLLQSKAKQLRDKYIDYVGSLDKDENSISWWASSFSEKNPLVSRVFRYACYIDITLDIIHASEDDLLLIVVDKKELKESLFQNVKAHYPTVDVLNIKYPLSDFNSNLKSTLTSFLVKTWFFIESLNRIIISNLLISRTGGGKEMTFLHSWIDKRSFQGDRYNDSYFGNLYDELKGRRETVVLIPYLLKGTSFYTAIQSMKKRNLVFLSPYGYLSLLDPVRVILSTFSYIPDRLYPKFERLDITDLINAEFHRDKRGIRLLRDLLLYYYVIGWKKSGLRIKSLIFTFENQTWNKIFILALKKYYPGIEIIGYQHAAISKMYLNYYFSPSEKGFIPLPDRVITNGAFNKGELIRAGYEEKRVKMGGAMRFKNVMDSSMNNQIRPSEKKVGSRLKILITFPVFKDEATELLFKTLKAFDDFKNVNIYLKFHPLTPFEKVKKTLDTPSLSTNFILYEDNMAQALKESDLLVYTSSTTCIEALAYGLPIIHVESDRLIDIDPLDFYPDARISVRTPKELKEAVERVIKNLKMFQKDAESNKRIVRELFGKVTPGTYNLFLTSFSS